MHDKECYDVLAYYKVEKYAVKDDDMRHVQDDQADDAKHHVGGGGGEDTRGRRTRERVKLPRTIAPKDLAPGKKVLHRKTERVKGYNAMIIGSELTNRN